MSDKRPDDDTKPLPTTLNVLGDGGAKSAKETDGGTTIVDPGLQPASKNRLVLFDAYRCGTCVSFNYDYDPDDRRVGWCSNPDRGGSKYRKVAVFYPKGDPLTRQGEKPCEFYRSAGKRVGG